MANRTRFPLLRTLVARVWLQALLLAVFLSAQVILGFIPEVKSLPMIHKVVGFLTVWIGTWLASRGLTVVREIPAVSSRLGPNLRLLVFSFFRILIYGLGFLVALDSIGVSITPFLASLGVGSLAIGLALQDTLGNLFSGFYLYLDRPIAPGDWIRTESGIEGQVLRIGWRSTHVIIGNESTVVIPNSKLSTSNITNFNLPTSETTLLIPLGVSYRADLAHVEQVLLETAKGVMAQKSSSFTGSAPQVRYTRFGDSSIDLVLSIQIRQYPELIALRHETIKAIKRSFDEAKIEIPYPQRSVHLSPAGG